MGDLTDGLSLRLVDGSMDKFPELVKGPAFKLDGDGQWSVEELPEDVLRDAEYTGEIKVKGYPAVVFETPSGEQWAQKAPGTPSGGSPGKVGLSAMAERVASRGRRA